jgi:hypothetical protein
MSAQKHYINTQLILGCFKEIFRSKELMSSLNIYGVKERLLQLITISIMACVNGQYKLSKGVIKV